MQYVILAQLFLIKYHEFSIFFYTNLVVYCRVRELASHSFLSSRTLDENLA